MYMSVFMPVQHCLTYCSFVISLKLGSMSPLITFLLFDIVLAILDSLHFHLNFKVSLPIFEKWAVRILIGIESTINLGIIVMLTIVYVQSHKHECLSIYLGLYLNNVL